ncbi:hypothetical protein BJ508DRAFT_411755 [Ascobolus immersus RN42]|uniref:Uncharacterized protein n=1 Tax=Ascobolus immersus RN42 TaxID=1160509 RepID=A0A3N4IVY0_ASCIM|nr:hypothetical protein BJ508DRAFT_411755 [Ascobolus immersus RN42]
MESRDNLLREFGQKVAEETRKLDQAMSRRLELVAQSCHQSIHWSLPCSPIDTAAANEFSMIRSSLREDESNFVISDSNSANVTVLNETATPAQLVEDHGSETEHNLSGEISPEIWTSYVYKRNRNRFLDSLPSIPAFSRSCESILSGISISRISEIALFELPILAKELYNGAVYRNNASEPTFSTSESCSSPTASNHALDQHKNSPSSIATAVNGKHIDKAAISPPILIGMSHSPRTIELHQAMLMHHPNSPPRTPTSMKVSIGAPTMPLTTCQTPTIELSQALLANSIRLSEPPTRHQRSRSAEINFSLPVAPLVIRKQLSASPVIC